MANANDSSDPRRDRTYRLILKYGSVALARAWSCPKTVIYQILDKRVGSTWVHESVVERVKSLGARELARRADVSVRQVLWVLEGGEISEPLDQFVSRHSGSAGQWGYHDTPTNEGLN
jgi:hypothetical protein